ncbi:FtsX-like permease family protein [Ekhidna sp.]|uniref:FtsX-like permease family protein n=1 Tax=Ekhidna sp. TaxID=2608089 RepID=UPI0032EDDD51
MNKTPPKYPLRFFRWFCNPDYVEDIEGDLLERFEKRTNEKKAARWLFTLDVFRLFRPGIIQNFEGTKKLNYYGMFKNYLKVGYRNLIRNKSNALINIGGLAIGITVFMLISLWIIDECSYDKNNQAHDRIAMVLKKRTLNSETGVRFALPIPIVDELRTNYREDFKHVTVTGWQGSSLIDTKEKQLNLIGNYMSANAPELLALDMKAGTREALKEKFSVIMSEQAVKALYGDENPIGNQVTIDGELTMTISGVFADLPRQSSFSELSFIANFDGYASTQDWIIRAKENALWGNNFCRVYVQLAENASLDVVNKKIEKIIYNNESDRGKENDPKVFLHPMKDWHLRTNWENGIQAGGPIQYVWLFGAIGIFVLLLACINFMNLSTAQAEKRAKEVGIRKSLGSMRSQLINQFLVESVLTVSISFALAITIALLALPYFNQLADKHIIFPIANLYFWLGGTLFVIVTSLIAASYPAFYLSGFQPVKVLKGTFSPGKASGNLRRVLVVTQFVISITLITGTIIVYQQINHSKNRPIGYDPTNLLSIRSSATAFQGKHQILADELLKSGSVSSMSQSSSPLTEINTTHSGFNWEGKDPELVTNFVFSFVTPGFGKTIKWTLKEGRDFTSKKSDEQTFIFNQSAIDFMGITAPVGKSVDWYGDSYRIIGIVDDLIIDSPFNQPRPAVYAVHTGKPQWMQIRLNESLPLATSVAQVEDVFDSVLPNVPFEFEFVDQQYQQKFSSVERIGNLSGIFALLAIFISALGLLGLVSYIAERKTKEIGIRKVLGASAKSIVWGLSSELGKLVIFASIIAVPLSYYASNKWLQGFAYRINPEWWYFLAAGFFGLLIAILTISKKSIQAATSNPVESLKDE